MQVIHHPEEQRFTLAVEGHTAVLEYTRHGDTLIFTHTGVPPAIGGRGIGSQLARAGLEYARQQNCRVRALCWFVSGYIERHPEYQDLRA
ncbi:MAG TPA: N-acetyltransferase [Chloroflexi bacterium]|nr:N-acetyltransferase [Chloroflexota bacterium]